MLDLEELFRKRPFIYRVNNVYYAFGVGVCARCDKNNNFITLPLDYHRYLNSIEKKDISQNEAWEIYRRLVFVANAVKSNEEHLQLIEKFSDLKFSEKDKEEIDKQLRDLVDFFKKHNLVEFYV